MSKVKNAPGYSLTVKPTIIRYKSLGDSDTSSGCGWPMRFMGSPLEGLKAALEAK
jgi:hypothetical protein